ncbi:MAG TPA: hypothetical protein PK079_13055 [Leptospiraceae bacterium]|nr:hypothetical protein [Leptospiraceae bacterium]HMW07646.1 hypothetical protein [Leptospiraceae bacterium]HMX33996.1 hypothetical protein [Leptospiraceae bacterium]HMY33235.1 hypothetical protein [Leptospiraceae bacterium]HMZ65741.1 hypothetical protein [Leptospiraceae bacterium]
MLFLFLLLLSFPVFGQNQNEDSIDSILSKIYAERDSFYADSFYEETLEKAYHAYLEKDFKRAIQKLDLIYSKYKDRDWRYYSIRGKVHEAKEEEDEAIYHFTFSIALNPAQPEIFKKLYELNFKIRRPVKSFDYIRLYLKENENDIQMRYRALILAKRLGNDEYVRYSLKKIQNLTPKELDINQINKEISDLISKNKIKEAKIEVNQYLPHFPINEELHSNLYIILRKLKVKDREIESALMDSAVLLSENTKYPLRLAMFYKERKRYLQALDLFRRIFYTTLSKQGFEMDTEIILFLKECYSELNQSNDVRATLSLMEIFSKKEKPEFGEWNSLRINFQNNREFLVSLLYYTKSNQMNVQYDSIKSILVDRDNKKADSERMNIYSVFTYDDFRNQIP